MVATDVAVKNRLAAFALGSGNQALLALLGVNLFSSCQISSGSLAVAASTNGNGIATITIRNKPTRLGIVLMVVVLGTGFATLNT